MVEINIFCSNITTYCFCCLFRLEYDNFKKSVNMKKALILALILVSTSVNAQRYHKKTINNTIPVLNNPMANSNWGTPQLYIPATILITTSSIGAFGNLNYQQQTSIVVSGMFISGFVYVGMKYLKNKNKSIGLRKRKCRRYKNGQ